MFLLFAAASCQQTSVQTNTAKPTETQYTKTEPQIDPSNTKAVLHSADIIPEISIQNFSFSPQNLNIKKGDSVKWTNKDSAPHTVTSDLFDKKLNQNETFIYTFDKAGSFDFHCSIHPSMTGKITVE